MELWIDAGNTRLKWQLCDGDYLLAKDAVVHKQSMADAIEQVLCHKALADNLAAGNIGFVGLASVLNEQAISVLTKAVKSRLGIDIVIAKVEKQFMGLKCAYQQPEKLGVDRWLALLSAYHRYNSAVCVVSFGSALTVDVASREGIHSGGFILPGIKMSIDALLGGTHSVRFNMADLADSLELGNDTASAVTNGVLFQAVALLSKLSEDIARKFSGESVKFVLTGGDSMQVKALLDKEGVGDFAIDQDLVIQGLRLALQSQNS